MGHITLMTDFGHRDGYVACMKGYLLSHTHGFQIHDVAHDVAPQNVWQAAMAAQRYTQHYPDNSIHLVVVDPGVGSERKALALKCDNHWLVGPDNGVLSFAAKEYKECQAYALRSHTQWWQKHDSFDGLALFAPAAAQLAQGTSIEEMADPLLHIHELVYPEAELVGNSLIGQVVAFDHFGNAITNIFASDIPKNQPLEIQCQSLNFPLCQHYCAAPAHGRLALINSDQQIELAVYQSSIRREADLKVGDLVSIALNHLQPA